MSDPTEHIRRCLQPITNAMTDDEIASTGKTWTTSELMEEFEVLGFLAPFVIVRRKADGVKGTMSFRHSPRVYFEFVPDGGR